MLNQFRLCLSVALSLLALASATVHAQALLPGTPPIPAIASGAGVTGPLFNGDVVVRFGSNSPRARCEQIVTALGCRIAGLDPGSGYALVRVRGGRMGDLLRVLAQRAEVLHAEPSYDLHADTLASLYDPYQWNLFPRGQKSARATSMFGIQAASAWTHTRGAGVTVAVVDTGAAYEDNGPYYQAPALANTHFAPGYNFVSNTDHPDDDMGHGTDVAGILADTLVDGGGTTGVAPEATVMPVKVLGTDGVGSDFVIAQGIRWAADHGAGVINLSLGGQGAGQVLSDACQYAASKDCVLVAAAGNENAPEVGYPAYYATCIAVGATGFDGVRAPYSNRGSHLWVVAPGGNLNQDLNGDGWPDGIVAQTFDPQKGYNSFDYIPTEGTSMAAPQVAGVVAMMRAANSALTALDIRLILRSTALRLGGTTGRNSYYGYGLVDALGAVEAALAQK